MILPLLFPQISSLDAILDSPALAGSTISACVRKLDGSVIYSRNDSLRVVPASNQKLLSATFALSQLGQNWAPEIRFWKRQGRLVIETTGNPMATTEELIAAQKELRLDRNTTKVLLRQPYHVGIPPSWEWDDMPNKYAAPVTAFTVDRGSVELWADSKTITWRPPAPDLRIKREAGQVLKVTYDPIRGIATVTGPLPATSTRLDTLALPNPDRSACLIFGREFAYTERVPTQKPDLVKAGPKLADITKECLVKSDNQIAEHLLLLAAERVGPLGKEPYKLASARLKAFLTDSCGLNGGDFRPDDGSGLSRHNLVTTRGLSQLLVWAMQQAWAPVWQGLLASPAQGTLKSRLPGSSFRGKTGTLDAVVALSGYVTTKGGETLVLSVIVNNSIVGDAATRKVVDQFAAAVEQLGTDIAYEPRREDPLSHSSHRALVADRLR